MDNISQMATQEIIRRASPEVQVSKNYFNIKIISIWRIPEMETSRLYVGNLTYSVTEKQLEELFSQYGDVKSVKIIGDKGFGFVEMGSPEEAEKAKEALNETVFVGRTMRIDEAQPPRPRREFQRY
jgi:RNA recognition motif-containing protein